MELHFPHLTHGIEAPKKVKKRRRLVPMLTAAFSATAVGAAIYIASA